MGSSARPAVRNSRDWEVINGSELVRRLCDGLNHCMVKWLYQRMTRKLLSKCPLLRTSFRIDSINSIDVDRCQVQHMMVRPSKLQLHTAYLLIGEILGQLITFNAFVTNPAALPISPPSLLAESSPTSIAEANLSLKTLIRSSRSSSMSISSSFGGPNRFR